MPTESQDVSKLSPSELAKLYAGGGFKGAYKDPEQDERFDAENPEFATAAGGIADSGEGKLALLYKSVEKYDPLAYTESQNTGDCVSHAGRNMADATRAVEIDIKGEPEGFVIRSATEPGYGSRGHSGQGMSCSREARFLTTDGGVLLRQPYLQRMIIERR